VGIAEVTAPHRRAVFLDRDGVLTRTIRRFDRHKGREVDGPAWTLDEVQLFPEVAGCVADLRAAGFTIIVVTNQPDVARGDLAPAAMHAINSHLRALVPGIDELIVCSHDGSWCPCRKPEPGMIYAGAVRFEIELARSYMVGDRAKDVDAGHRAGCRVVWIRNLDHQEAPPESPAECEVRTLRQATDWILAQERHPAQ